MVITQNAVTYLTAIENIATVLNLKADDILSVYSGKAGKCCCGCSGKHYANPKNRTAAEAARGYAYDDNEVRGGQITRVLGLLQADPGGCDVASNYVARTIDGRLYVAYTSR
jgi:hypothetical protein